jgi:translocation and assembly module TamA
MESMRVPKDCRWGFLALALIAATRPAQAQTQPAENTETLDPESPLSPMPEIGVDWPDMNADVPTLPNIPVETVAPPAASSQIAPPPVAAGDSASDGSGERRYAVVVEGLDAANRQTVMSRFNALSALKSSDGKPANVAQIDRRAREDVQLLDNLLRAEGFYDANIETTVEGTDSLTVRMIVEPGPIYTFERVDVAGLASTGDKAAEFRRAFGVEVSEPVSADEVIGGRVALDSQLRAEGYPFANIGEPDVVVDHETRTATLNLLVDPGGLQRFGKIVVSGKKPPFGAKHVAVIARFKSGEVYDQAKMDDLKRALIATGIISVADVKPVPSGTPGVADVAVGLDPAPMRTIAGEVGYGTGEGFRVEASWTHRNLIKPEGAVTFRGVAGTQEQYIGALLRQSNFRKRDQVLNARFSVSNANRDAYDARTIEIGAGIERQTNIIWQKKWTWSLGTELIATDERDVSKFAGGGRRTFFISAFPGTLGYDGSDDLLNPTKGFRLSARVSPEISFQNGTFGYVRGQLDGSAYVPAGEKLVIAGRARLGTIVGASAPRIAPSRRFYAGGGGSVRGYGYQAIGPRDAFNDPIGGRSLAEFALEARVRFGDFGVVPFIDGGNISTGSLPGFKSFRFGAGVGARYYSSFGPIRIDVGTPLNRQKGDPRVAVYVSLGQAF